MTRADVIPFTDWTLPLFVPLKREWFEAFERGEKTQEIRRYGTHYNERTCRVGRAAILRLGYSGRELRARVTGFVRETRDSDIYGPAADCAVIDLVLDVRTSDIIPPTSDTIGPNFVRKMESNV